MPNIDWTKLSAAGPLTLALLLGLAVVVLLILHGPKLLDRLYPERAQTRAAKADADIERRLRGVENHVRDLRGWYMDIRESHEELRVRVEQVAGDVRATNEGVRGAREKLDDLCERVDRNDAVMGGRLDRLDDRLGRIADRILGPSTPEPRRT